MPGIRGFTTDSAFLAFRQARRIERRRGPALRAIFNKHRPVSAGDEGLHSLPLQALKCRIKHQVVAILVGAAKHNRLQLFNLAQQAILAPPSPDNHGSRRQLDPLFKHPGKIRHENKRPMPEHKRIFIGAF